MKLPNNDPSVSLFFLKTFVDSIITKSLINVISRQRKEIFGRLKILDDPCFPDSNGNLPLHLVILDKLECESNIYDACKHLIEQYPDAVLIPNIAGSFPIHISASRGFFSVVSMLLDCCPNSLYFASNDGCLPIHMAALGGHTNICMEMLNRDLKILNIRTKQGMLPEDIAIKSGYLSLHKCLRQYRCSDSSVQCSFGSTSSIESCSSPVVSLHPRGILGFRQFFPGAPSNSNQKCISNPKIVDSMTSSAENEASTLSQSTAASDKRPKNPSMGMRWKSKVVEKNIISSNSSVASLPKELIISPPLAAVIKSNAKMTARSEKLLSSIISTNTRNTTQSNSNSITALEKGLPFEARTTWEPSIRDLEATEVLLNRSCAVDNPLNIESTSSSIRNSNDLGIEEDDILFDPEIEVESLPPVSPTCSPPFSPLSQGPHGSKLMTTSQNTKEQTNHVSMLNIPIDSSLVDSEWEIHSSTEAITCPRSWLKGFSASVHHSSTTATATATTTTTTTITSSSNSSDNDANDTNTDNTSNNNPCSLHGNIQVNNKSLDSGSDHKCPKSEKHPHPRLNSNLFVDPLDSCCYDYSTCSSTQENPIQPSSPFHLLLQKSSQIPNESSCATDLRVGKAWKHSSQDPILTFSSTLSPKQSRKLAVRDQLSPHPSSTPFPESPGSVILNKSGLGDQVEKLSSILECDSLSHSFGIVDRSYAYPYDRFVSPSSSVSMTMTTMAMTSDIHSCQDMMMSSSTALPMTDDMDMKTRHSTSPLPSMGSGKHNQHHHSSSTSFPTSSISSSNSTNKEILSFIRLSIDQNWRQQRQECQERQRRQIQSLIALDLDNQSYSTGYPQSENGLHQIFEDGKGESHHDSTNRNQLISKILSSSENPLSSSSAALTSSLPYEALLSSRTPRAPSTPPSMKSPRAKVMDIRLPMATVVSSESSGVTNVLEKNEMKSPRNSSARSLRPLSTKNTSVVPCSLDIDDSDEEHDNDSHDHNNNNNNHNSSMHHHHYTNNNNDNDYYNSIDNRSRPRRSRSDDHTSSINNSSINNSSINNSSINNSSINNMNSNSHRNTSNPSSSSSSSSSDYLSNSSSPSYNAHLSHYQRQCQKPVISSVLSGSFRRPQK